MLHHFARSSLFCKIAQNRCLCLQNIRCCNTAQPEPNEASYEAADINIHARKVDKIPTRKPAFSNDTISLIETPSLLLNMQQLQNNINSMNNYIDTSPNKVILRPITNIHKSSDIIQLQLKMHNQPTGSTKKIRMEGIGCSTINESELLINSASNFLSPNTEYKIRDILLCNICIDLPKMCRFVQLYDTTVSNMRLSTFIDDIFQVHLWNYTMDEFKKTNQNISNLHSSSSGDGRMHQSAYLKLGVTLVLKSKNDELGININSDDGIESIREIFDVLSEYGNNLYFRGFHVDKKDETAKDWILNTDNQKRINVDSYFDKLHIGNVNEIYDDEYIFDNCGLTILSTISNVYYEGDKFIHLLDCGYNSYADLPLEIAKYHRPNYVLNNDTSLSTMIMSDELNTYKCEIVNNNNNQHNTLLICDNELDVGGKVELVPNGYNATVNLYNYFTIVNNDKQTVEAVWQIDARGPGH